MESPFRPGAEGRLRWRSGAGPTWRGPTWRGRPVPPPLAHPGARERRNAQKGWLSRCATTLYFALWYLLSIGHSVTGKQLTNALPLPWSVAAAQIVVGALFALCLWLTGLRAPPTGTLGGMARNEFTLTNAHLNPNA
jgi:hypothetical protein